MSDAMMLPTYAPAKDGSIHSVNWYLSAFGLSLPDVSETAFQSTGCTATDEGYCLTVPNGAGMISQEQMS